MIEDEELNIKLAKHEALVLFDFLARFGKTDHPHIVERQAEQKTLWILEAQLEKLLDEPFLPNYKAIIDEARSKIRF